MSWTLTMKGEGPVPYIGLQEGPVAPPEPPGSIPPVLPPSPPSDYPNTPFPWPPPLHNPERDEQRYTALGDRFYVSLMNFTNPLPGSHAFAGMLLAGPHAGEALWAPRDAVPSSIRRALATGRP